MPQQRGRLLRSRVGSKLQAQALARGDHPGRQRKPGQGQGHPAAPAAAVNLYIHHIPGTGPDLGAMDRKPHGFSAEPHE